MAASRLGSLESRNRKRVLEFANTVTSPMLRSMSFGLSPLPLGFSVALHAALLLGPTEPKGYSYPASEDAIDIDLVTVSPPTRAASDVGSTLPPRLDRAMNQLAPARPRSLSSRHGIPSPAASYDRTNDDVPRFTIAIGAVSGAGGAVSPPSRSISHADGDAVASEHSVDVLARLLRGMPAPYPDAARADGIEGDVRLELLVGVSGAVESARVVAGIGHGLDEVALRAVRQFLFTPAIKDGRPVRVLMGWSMQFRLE